MTSRIAVLSILFCCCVLLALPAEGASRGARYLGAHALGVNRVSAERRSGSVTISEREGLLWLEGEARKGPYYLKLSGSIARIDDREMVVNGELTGAPDESFRGEAARERTTRGRYTFRVTKGRKFWRLYDVDGRDCVCGERCGNDYCYIDIDLLTKPAR